MGNYSGNTVGLPAATWTSNNAYIMWKDVPRVTNNIDTDFSAASQGNYFGFDDNYLGASTLTLISTSAEIVLIIFSWMPFSNWYYNRKNLAIDNNESSNTALDGNGCKSPPWMGASADCSDVLDEEQ